MASKHIYLIGSLRNPEVPKVAKVLRDAGHEVFDDWYAAGPNADDWWQKYETDRGHDFATALKGHAGQHVYQYDKSHLDRCGVGVLLMPAGKSGHLELGYMIGQGKPGYILLPSEPERFDVMYNFASGIYTNTQDLINELNGPTIRPGTGSGLTPILGIDPAVSDRSRHPSHNFIGELKRSCPDGEYGGYNVGD